MDRTDHLSDTSLYDRFTPPSVIYDNPREYMAEHLDLQGSPKVNNIEGQRLGDL